MKITNIHGSGHSVARLSLHWNPTVSKQGLVLQNQTILMYTCTQTYSGTILMPVTALKEPFLRQHLENRKQCLQYFDFIYSVDDSTSS
jgi:hypothetical protein